MIFYDSQSLKHSKYVPICEVRAKISLGVLSQAIGPSFVIITKQLKNKIRERFCAGMKQMCKLSEID